MNKYSPFNCKVVRVRLRSRLKTNTFTFAFIVSGVLFENGVTEEDIDAVIYATGYMFGFPFMEDVIKVDNNKVRSRGQTNFNCVCPNHGLSLVSPLNYH